MLLKDINKKSVRTLTNQQLLEMHRKMHMLYAGAKKRKLKQEFIDLVKEKHEIIVAEMERRGMNHKSPLSKVYNPKILESYLHKIQERRKQISRHSVSRKTKIKRSQSQLSNAMARKRNDPLYKMYKKYCEMCKKYREKIHKKYAGRTRSKARR